MDASRRLLRLAGICTGFGRDPRLGQVVRWAFDGRRECGARTL